VCFLGRVCEAKKPTWAYVYSWDHPCKHATFTRRLTGYFVWNELLVEDMEKIQGISSDACRVIGASQLAMLAHRPRLSSCRPIESPYIYFGCGVGSTEMAHQEVRLIRWVADTLAKALPDHKLVVRPYPMLTSDDPYSPLRGVANIQLDNGYRTGRPDRSLSSSDIEERLCWQEHASAFVHIGTTMGFEGAYLGCPILFLDPSDFDYGVPHSYAFHLRRFIHQYHNERYMLLEGYPNVIRRCSDLETTLQRVVRHRDEFMPYSRQIAAATQLRSLDAIASDIVCAIRGNVPWHSQPALVATK
jgi:hypothetical protein